MSPQKKLSNLKWSLIRRGMSKLDALRAAKMVVRKAAGKAPCLLCLLPLTLLSVSADHVVPLSRGGANTPANIWPVHKRCNMAKGDMRSEEFLGLVAYTKANMPHYLPNLIARLIASGWRYRG